LQEFPKIPLCFNDFQDNKVCWLWLMNTPDGMEEVTLLQLLANGPRCLKDIEHEQSCSHVGVLSAAVSLQQKG
jgi:hypothetical protein